jgi:hypothetical protein
MRYNMSYSEDHAPMNTYHEGFNSSHSRRNRLSTVYTIRPHFHNTEIRGANPAMTPWTETIGSECIADSPSAFTLVASFGLQLDSGFLWSCGSEIDF